MRRYTFALSLTAHALFIGAAIVAPIFATGDLPEPARSSTFILVRPQAPPVPPPAPRPIQRSPAAAVNQVPIVEPDGFTPEAPTVPPSDLSIADNVVDGAGGIPESLVLANSPVAPPPAPRAAQATVRPGGDIKVPVKIQHVAPVYPPLARNARVSGTVILEAVIAEDGTVQDVRVLRSIRLLDDAAVDAVRQWRFTPTLLNGQPVRVLMTVTVSFALN